MIFSIAALNRAAWTLGRWVAAGALEQAEVEDALYTAAERLGLVVDDGQRQTWATIRSGLSAGCFYSRSRYRKKLGRQTFRVEEAFSIGQVGSRALPEPTLKGACCLPLSELLTQGTPLRQILWLQVSGAESMLLAGGRDQSDAATRQEHRRGHLAAARAPLAISH